jgi:hypothetical protein
MITLMKDQELPGDAVDWYDRAGAIIDFSTGWTFTVKICAAGTTAVAATKTLGIVGGATIPNVTIAWSATDFTALTAGTTYVWYLYARRTADSLDRVFRPADPPAFQLVAAPA